MKILCSKNNLLTGIQIVQKAVAAKTTLPVLSGIFMQTVNGKVRMIASDAEISIETYIDARVEEPGEIVIPARYFSEIIRYLPKEDVLIDINPENHNVFIRCGQAEFNLNGMNPDEFPPFVQLAGNLSFSIEQKLFKEMIRQTIFAVSVNEARPIFTGLLLSVEDQQATMVATDTHRLAVKNGRIKTGKDIQVSIIIPGKTMGEIFRLLKDDGELEVRVSERQVAFQIGSTCVISRLLEGKFPNYKAVIPKDFRIVVRAFTQEMMGAIERASLLARESGNTVKLELKNDRIIFESFTPEIGSTHEEIRIANNAEELKISFNSKYLIDVLKILDTEEVELYLSDSLSPGVFRPFGEEDFLYLVLPIRTRN